MMVWMPIFILPGLGMAFRQAADFYFCLLETVRENKNKKQIIHKNEQIDEIQEHGLRPDVKCRAFGRLCLE